ncbi:Protein CBG13398 [Caenorhabditis briggsae]|uniref:Protein CBG13398 n=2 Tax=Caenorhabditis briggsae TaxID=6238 RepID=A8XHV0_CAEBR|nr:Protein CBG13398 [Caenorhabditis briggsae]ULU04202.1 hypothetical protein L3Y34_017176 [Caenorhabditis briggsae]CAP32216.1 Protein CBG13398 [Caenorhabditis briggsae]
MECSQNDVINASETDFEIDLDDVINNNNVGGTETDIFNNLLTAISESLSNISVNTAMTGETVEQSLNAHADPSLNTRISMSTASEFSVQTPPLIDHFYCNPKPLQVWKDENGIKEFEMTCNEKKVVVVDSLECLERLQNNYYPLEPVYFDPRVYLTIPYGEPEGEFDFEQESKYEVDQEDDVVTAELGPNFEEFEDWVQENGG